MNNAASDLSQPAFPPREERHTACAGCLTPGLSNPAEHWPLTIAEQTAGDGALLAAGHTREPVSLARDGDVHICLVGTPAWRDDALAREATARGDAQAALGLWPHGALKLLEKLSGAFALMVIDTRRQQVLLATDLFASCPLNYAPTDDGGIAFATAAGALLSHPRVHTDLDPQAVFDYLYFHVIPAPRTIYRGISRLRAGEYLLFGPGESVQPRRYWEPEFPARGARGDMQALGASLRNRLSSAVDGALDGAEESTACFLSGGLDSSTVTGLYADRLTQRRGEGAQQRAYTIGFPAEGFDEMEYARIAAGHFGVQLRERYISPDEVAEAMPYVASWYDEPFGNSSAVPAYLCARTAAQEGVTRMLAGDGGDELFAGNSRYVRQQLFGYFSDLPAFAQATMRRALLLSPGASRSPLSAIPGFSKLVSYVAQASLSLPERIDSYNFLVRYGASQVLSADWLAQIDTQAPMGLTGGLLDQAPSRELLHRMLYLDWQLTLADNDLRKVSGMCSAAGVQVRYPMLDPQVLALSLEVPSNELIRGHRLRHFYKESMKSFLPAQIITKSKHGFGLPFGIWLNQSSALRDVVYPALDSASRRGIVNPAFIDRMRSAHREEHAYYYGNMLWVVVMLELWLDAHGVS